MGRGAAVRESVLCLLAAGAASATVAWLALYGFAWNDYETEALPALQALTHGHILTFLRLTPAYGGSLVLRAPFALLPDLWGGGELAVYRMVALPCLLSAAALGVWLTADMRSRRTTAGSHPSIPTALARAIVLGLCVANPLTVRALELGHPEDLLGASLCVAAVLLALRDRPLWTGVLLGAAIANKEWALLAVGPVLLALPPSRRAACLLAGAAVAAVLLAPPALVASGGFLTAVRGSTTHVSAIFQPWQAWWFLGRHGPTVHGLFGELKPGYRTAPAWVGDVSHPLIVALSLPLTALAWTGSRRRAGRSGSDALLLLALLMLLRCVLDVWDAVYYLLPFVLALTAWESMSERGLPMLALASTALAWVSFQWLPSHAGADIQAAFFLAWTLPLAVALAVRLYAPAALASAARAMRRPSAPWAGRLAPHAPPE